MQIQKIAKFLKLHHSAPVSVSHPRMRMPRRPKEVAPLLFSIYFFLPLRLVF